MPRTRRVSILFFCSGFAALSWELLWQIYAGIAVGASARSVAITVSLMMGGMTLGGVVGGAFLARRAASPRSALRRLAAIEAFIAVAGLMMPLGFRVVAACDAAVAARHPTAATLVQVACISLLIGPAAVAMGATVPLMRPFAADARALVGLYAANTFGAVAGVFLQAFAVIPALGLRGAGALTATVNLVVALAAFRAAAGAAPAADAPAAAPGASVLPSAQGLVVALLTGFVTFALEVAWFRSLKAAFQSTTDSFALMLGGVLVAIACGAVLARRAGGTRATLGLVASAAAIAIVGANAVVDRADLFDLGARAYWVAVGKQIAFVVPLIGLPILLVAAILPVLFRGVGDARALGRLYATNTIGCVLGSVASAWLLLPWIGAYRTALACAALMGLLGASLLGRWRVPASLAVAAALLLGLRLDSGVGRVRVQARELSAELRPIASLEGADATVSIATDAAGDRQLIIDGFQTSGEAPQGHYMAWMGHLPMLAHHAPKRALVICFGTGQTANAVRREGPDRLDIVELSPEVIALAHHFASNQGVLDDPRVQVHLTDGRAWLRRSTAPYDVVTLEPMEPHFAGTNDLYSLEFYAAVARHVADDGVVAQWVPLHLLLPFETASVVATFVEVFPDAALWIDPRDRTGVLIGRKAGPRPIADDLDAAAMARAGVRDLTAADVAAGFALRGAALRQLAAVGTSITDDDQLLAYGTERHRLWSVGGHEANHQLNLAIIEALARAR